jgi:predicted dienelactone hydrolase
VSWFRHLPPWLVRVAIALAALGLAAAMLAVGYVEANRNQTVVLPEPTGPYAVGRVAYDWVDAAREDSLAPSRGIKRELLVWVWYPAAPAAPGAAVAEYLPANWRGALEQDRGPVGTQIFQNLAAVHPHAIAGVGLSDTQRQHQVLIFMPGYGNIAPYYTALAEELASHGYVVVGINPTYTTTIVFPDGRLTSRTAAGTIPETPNVAAANAAADRLVIVWAGDARFVMDRLAELNAGPGGKLAGRLDLSRIGLFGPSLGGAAALETCRLDNRCRAGVDLDGNLYGDVARLGLEQPAMFLLSAGAESSDLAEQAKSMPESVGGDGQKARYILSIEGARHFNFTDYSVTFSPAIKLLGALGSIDGRRGLEITGAYVREFFDHYLSAQPAPLLTGPSSTYPEVRSAVGEWP